MEVGTQLYYLLENGKVILSMGDSKGDVPKLSLDEAYSKAKFIELQDYKKEEIGLLEFEYGEYKKLSEGATDVSVDVETKQPIFTYDEIPLPPQPPSKYEELDNKISILEAEQSVQNDEILTSMLATSDLFEIVLNMSGPATMNIQENNTNTGGNNMVELYVTLILKGVKTIEDVPVIIRAQVAERLRQLEVPVK